MLNPLKWVCGSVHLLDSYLSTYNCQFLRLYALFVGLNRRKPPVLKEGVAPCLRYCRLHAPLLNVWNRKDNPLRHLDATGLFLSAPNSQIPALTTRCCFLQRTRLGSFYSHSISLYRLPMRPTTTSLMLPQILSYRPRGAYQAGSESLFWFAPGSTIRDALSSSLRSKSSSGSVSIYPTQSSSRRKLTPRPSSPQRWSI